MKHIHADLMAQYAQDAMESDKPWERWEFRDFDVDWSDCRGHPSWMEHRQYRRKPQTITRTITYTEPLKEPPENRVVYMARPDIDTFYLVPKYFKNDRSLKELVRRGLLHTTKEAAIAHAKAMVGVEE